MPATDGNDVLISGPGPEVLAGGMGDDSYWLNDADDLVIENANEGFDRVFTYVSYVLRPGTYVEVLSTTDYGSTVDINLTGNEFDNELYGNNGRNILVGGGGADVLFGYGGDDEYRVTDARTVIVEEFNRGVDRVFTYVSYGLTPGSRIEILSTTDYGSTVSINLSGNEFNNELYGNAGSNILRGGGGADILFGYGGDDTYIVEDAFDTIVEGVNGGTDTVIASVSYTLTPNAAVEIIRTSDQNSTAAINLTGSAYSNSIYGNQGANTLIDGGGTDTLTGFGGNDTYVITGNALVIEAGFGGFDTVYTYASYTLPAGQEIEVLAATWDTGLIAHHYTLTGNEYINAIYGSFKSDWIDGGAGADTMVGYEGDDEYWVDNPGDIVIEDAPPGSGTDWVRTTCDYTLPANVEILVPVNEGGFEPLRLTGNGASNYIYGNRGDNIIDGGGGSDTLIGGDGNDTYIVRDSRDNVSENFNSAAPSLPGIDSVLSTVSYTLTANVENIAALNPSGTGALDFTGNTLDNIITGNDGQNILQGLAGNDTIDGRGGADVIIGGLGLDVLTGGSGQDIFRYLSASESTAGQGIDRITDFVSGTDRIDLAGIDANSGSAGDDAFTFIGTGAFTGVAGQLRYEIIENENAIRVLGDVNGDGTADITIVLSNTPSVVATDFFL